MKNTRRTLFNLIALLLIFSLSLPAGVVQAASGPGKEDRKESLQPPELLKHPELPDFPRTGKDKNPKEDYGLIPTEAKDKTLEFEPGVVVVRFNDDSLIGPLIKELLEGKQEISSLLGKAEPKETDLDAFFKQHPIEKIERVYPGLAKEKLLNQGTISKAAAEQIRDQAKALFYTKFQQMQAKYPQRAKRAPLGKANQPPYLANTYKITFKDKAGSIKFLAEALAKNKEIKYAQPNYKMQLYFEPNDPYYHSRGHVGGNIDDLWALKPNRINAEEAWDIVGMGGRRRLRLVDLLVVAVIDTGVDYNHPDIAANIWRNPNEEPDNNQDDDGNGLVDDIRGYDFSGNDRGRIIPDNDPSDSDGHGTHCAGTIAAIGNNELGIIGVAPEARIMPVKIFPNAYTNVAATGLRYAADMGADVLSNSWGPEVRCLSNPALEEAIDYAHTAGCVVVFAAGNNNDDVRYYSPNNRPNVINVAATDYDDARAGFSNYGSGIDVSAPGVAVLSLRAAGTDMYENGRHIVDENYYRADGTSMACPHVAGLAALILSHHPDFTNEELRSAIRASADDLGVAGIDSFFGAGRIDANQALQIESVCIARMESESPVPYRKYNRQEVPAFEIRGTAAGRDFQSYTLSYRNVNAQNSVQIGEVHREQVRDGILGVWDISQLDGAYYLILSVRDAHSRVFEYMRGLFYIISSKEIRTLDELQDIKSNLVGTYYLANDIDASETASWNNGAGFTPLGNYWSDSPFQGVLDGRGHIIYNLTVGQAPGFFETYKGLFGFIGEMAEIKNIGLVNIHVTGGYCNIAGLAASNHYGTITNCYVTGEVRAYAPFEMNAYKGFIGGLVGYNYGGTITNCYTAVNVSGDDHNGLGGVVGFNIGGMISNAYATGNVNGNNCVGGLVGYAWASSAYNSYAIGNVSGNEGIGGLVGLNSHSGITNSYAAGEVMSNGWHVGGLVGLSEGLNEQYYHSYWDIQTTGQEYGVQRGDRPNLAGIQGRTTAQMMQENTYPHLQEGQEQGWDFEETWFMPEEGSFYPHLRIEENSFASQEINLLRNGWNTISFYVEPDIKGLRQIIQPLIDEGSLIMLKDDLGHFIRQAGGQWVNIGITEMDTAKGYQLQVNRATTLSLRGKVVTLPKTIPLRQGWNIMGYPCAVEQPAMDVLQQLVDAGVEFVVRGNPGVIIRQNNIQVNSFRNFIPGKGYQIHVDRDVDLVVRAP